MKKMFALEHLLSKKEIKTLSSLIDQTVDGIYVHQEDYQEVDKDRCILRVSFKSRLMIRVSSSYYLFNNDFRFNKFNEFVNKVAFTKYKLGIIDHNWEYRKFLDFSFEIDSFEVYTVSYEIYKEEIPLYKVSSDTLIVISNTFGDKIAILAEEYNQDSISIYYNTKIIESELLLRTFNDGITPKYQKRIDMTKNAVWVNRNI